MPDSTATKCHICPAGRYCVGDHLTPALCPAGFYCPNGTGYNWQACPPGTFSNTLGLSLVSGMNQLNSYMQMPSVSLKFN